MQKLVAVLAAILISIGGIVFASPASATVCTTSADSGVCPGDNLNYTYSPDIWSNGSNTYIANNIWNHSQLPSATQTLTATDPGNWQVTANMASGNTAIISGPQVRQDFLVNNAPAPLSGFPAIYAFSTDNLNANSATDAEAGYDIWTGQAGDSATNFSQEMMIWTDQRGRGNCGGASTVVTGVQFGGSNGVPAQSWNLCVNGSLTHTSEFIWWLPGAQMPSGAVNVRSMLGYLINHGYYPSTTGLDQIDQTFEIASTGGVSETMTEQGFALNDTGFAQNPQPPPVPTGLSTNAIGQHTATAHWASEPAATSFHLQLWKTANPGVIVRDKFPAGGSTSWRWGKLAINTSYTWHIAATNANGTSAYSSNVTFRTLS